MEIAIKKDEAQDEQLGFHRFAMASVVVSKARETLWNSGIVEQ